MNQSFLNDQVLILTCLCLSVFRIYLEVIQFDFAKLPITKSLPKEKQVKIHRYGFYLSVGYFILFAPSLLTT
jgi:hypothetical protein